MADALKIVSEFALSVDFSTDKLGPDFMWFNPPPKWQMKFHGDSGGMKVVPRGKTDFWRRTYYKPELIKDNGHLLHLIVKQEMCIIETSFDLTAVNQFDQAGIMIRMGNERWMKIGLEFVDGTYRASCVVTNKYSDWSTQDWHDGKLALRIHKICDDYVIECKPRAGSNDQWKFIRITHMDSGGHPIQIGLYCCAPTGEGMDVVFDKFTIHSSDGRHPHNNNA
ncbi:regulation of enolase protein 1 isoform X2 [Nematostella vectensis]|uniref:regulation of enolase protein 1 isoform X2 n=1 Tax=Nematostella vectensis TaxID=45351 RepID=UPI0013900A00|nr:regulation of enolase protein 1 isoform X2 [Nematostella vectensis]